MQKVMARSSSFLTTNTFTEALPWTGQFRFGNDVGRGAQTWKLEDVFCIPGQSFASGAGEQPS